MAVAGCFTGPMTDHKKAANEEASKSTWDVCSTLDAETHGVAATRHGSRILDPSLALGLTTHADTSVNDK
jgi:hypothetical protein